MEILNNCWLSTILVFRTHTEDIRRSGGFPSRHCVSWITGKNFARDFAMEQAGAGKAP